MGPYKQEGAVVLFSDFCFTSLIGWMVKPLRNLEEEAFCGSSGQSTSDFLCHTLLSTLLQSYWSSSDTQNIPKLIPALFSLP